MAREHEKAFYQHTFEYSKWFLKHAKMGAALREEFFSMTTVSKSFHRALLRNASSTAGDTNVSVD